MKQRRCSKTRRMARAAQAGVLALLSVLAVEAWSQCTTRERIELRREGYGSREIEAICDDNRPRQRGLPLDSRRALPQVASICMTQVGSCPMRTAIPVGSYCQCYTPYGIFPGVAR